MFHYIPLHSSDFYSVLGPVNVQCLPITSRFSEKLVRLPLHLNLRDQQTNIVFSALSCLE